MIDSIINVVNSLLGMSEQFRKVKAERRDKIVKYLNNVADCASRIASALRDGKTPNSACGELEFYFKELPEVLKEELEPRQFENLLFLTGRVHKFPTDAIVANFKRNLDLKITQLTPKFFLNKEIAAIEDAAGKLKALAVSVELSK